MREKKNKKDLEKNKKVNKKNSNTKLNPMENIDQDIIEQAMKHKNEEEKTFNFTIYEYCMSLFLLLFIVNCFFGKSTNEYIAMQWFKANENFYAYNYAHIGHENNYSNFNLNSPFL